MRTSRQGLVRCPACRAHVRAGETPSATDCPFCGANLREGRARVVMAAGRGGILAASLLALSACGASMSSEDSPEPVTEPVTRENDQANQNDHNDQNTELAEDEDRFQRSPSDDPAPVEAYGIAPSERIDEPRDQPLYGIPE